MNQLWARKIDPAVPLLAASEVIADIDLDQVENLHQCEVDIVQMQPQDDAVASVDNLTAAPTPFAFLSDYAFWEGLSGNVPDIVAMQATTCCRPFPAKRRL
jgi:hypothetical protein